MNIRPATTADLPALVAINHTVQELHARLRPDLIRSPNTHDMTPHLAAMLAKENYCTLLAEDNGQPVGHAIFEIRTREATLVTCGRRSTYVHQMSVAPEAQRQGVGKALLLLIREASRKLGIIAIELDVWSANVSARAFYQALGFTPVREVLEWQAG